MADRLLKITNFRRPANNKTSTFFRFGVHFFGLAVFRLAATAVQIYFALK